MPALDVEGLEGDDELLLDDELELLEELELLLDEELLDWLDDEELDDEDDEELLGGGGVLGGCGRVGELALGQPVSTKAQASPSIATGSPRRSDRALRRRLEVAVCPFLSMSVSSPWSGGPPSACHSCLIGSPRRASCGCRACALPAAAACPRCRRAEPVRAAPAPKIVG
ncbi:MAG: hypothetical protein V2I82_01940 [Halieaceae bacterium]|nr:hypothetical protein [Halieaceae bacterium]